MRFWSIILAAGKGTRMKSDLPKVLHEVCGRPMLAYVVDACRQAGCDKLLVVIGHQADRVRRTFADDDGDIVWVEQVEQLGTGHAVMVCEDRLRAARDAVVVVAGDSPLYRPETLGRLVATHLEAQAACTVGTSVLEDPARYGRIVRDADGHLERIVEYLDATEEQRRIREVNVSLYCFDPAALLTALPKLGNDNAKGEYYITDVLGILKSSGARVAAVPAVPASEVLGINTVEDLECVSELMAERLAEREQSHG